MVIREMTFHELPQKEVELFIKIINNKLLYIPQKNKENFPEILKKSDTKIITLNYENIVIINFIDQSEKERITSWLKKGYQPYPRLIARTKDEPVFMSIEHGSSYLQDNTIKNLNSIYLGDDSTAIICNHTVLMF